MGNVIQIPSAFGHLKSELIGNFRLLQGLGNMDRSMYQLESLPSKAYSSVAVSSVSVSSVSFFSGTDVSTGVAVSVSVLLPHAVNKK